MNEFYWRACYLERFFKLKLHVTDVCITSANFPLEKFIVITFLASFTTVGLLVERKSCVKSLKSVHTSFYVLPAGFL